MKRNMAGLLLCFVVALLTACGKVEYEEHCIDKMLYTFNNDVPFIILEIEDKDLYKNIASHNLKPRIGFANSLSEVSIAMKDDLLEVKSNSLLLKGPVIRFQSAKRKFEPRYLNLFYAEIAGTSMWISSTSLALLKQRYSNETNSRNQAILEKMSLDEFVHGGELTCGK